VIRNVAVHIENEQPLLADLYDVPAASDAGLLCTNLRAMDGKRPVFIDRIENAFFFPYRAIRFLEIPAGALQQHHAETGAGTPAARREAAPVAVGQPESTLPVVVEAGPPELDVPEDLGDEIDEDFLRRIREV
jgi:hypothetical protein